MSDIYDLLKKATVLDQAMANLDSEVLLCIGDWMYLLGSCCNREDMSEIIKHQMADVRLFFANRDDLKKIRQDMIDEDDFSLGDFYQKVGRLQEEDGFDFESTFLYGEAPASPPDSASRYRMNQLYTDTAPCLRIDLTRDMADAIAVLWDPDCRKVHVPADIFFGDHVVWDDMEIYVTREVEGTPVVHSMRVTLFPGVHDFLQKCRRSSLSDSEDQLFSIGYYPCGGIDVRLPGNESKGFVFLFGFCPGCDYLVLDMYPSHYGLSDEDLAEIGSDAVVGKWIRLCSKYLRTWYSLQLLAQHPVYGAIFDSMGTRKDKRKRISGQKLAQLSRKESFCFLTQEKLDACGDCGDFYFRNGFWEVHDQVAVYYDAGWMDRRDDDGQTPQEDEEDSYAGTDCKDAGREGEKAEAQGKDGED